MISACVTRRRPASRTLPTVICANCMTMLSSAPQANESVRALALETLPTHHVAGLTTGANAREGLVDRMASEGFHLRITLAVRMHAIVAEGLFHRVPLVGQGFVIVHIDQAPIVGQLSQPLVELDDVLGGLGHRTAPGKIARRSHRGEYDADIIGQG